MSALLRLMRLPVYGRLWSELDRAVERAERAVMAALTGNERQAREAAILLKSLKASAAELPDGRKTFRAQDGHAHAEDGLCIENPSQCRQGQSSPSWKEFEAARATFAALEHERLQIEEYESGIVNRIKVRVGDGNDPYKLDELLKSKDELIAAMPESVQRAFSKDDWKAASLSTVTTTVTGLPGQPTTSSPVLRADFKSVHAEALTSSPERE